MVGVAGIHPLQFFRVDQARVTLCTRPAIFAEAVDAMLQNYLLRVAHLCQIQAEPVPCFAGMKFEIGPSAVEFTLCTLCSPLAPGEETEVQLANAIVIELMVDGNILELNC